MPSHPLHIILLYMHMCLSNALPPPPYNAIVWICACLMPPHPLHIILLYMHMCLSNALPPPPYNAIVYAYVLV